MTAEEAEECGGCGNPLSISTDPATQQTWEVHRRTCEACRVLEATVENDNEGSRPRGMRYQVSRRADH